MTKRLLPASIALLLSPVALAEVPHVVLDPINVTVSRNPQSASRTPARVTVIGEREIKQNPTLNLSDVLKQDASIHNKTQWGGIGQPSNLSLRGTNPTHTLVLKDGARLNSQNDVAPLYPAFLDLSDVNQIEIVKGPASVQYGSDAIGGVIQMRTLTPTKNRAFITGVYGENQTYKAIAGSDLVHDGVYAQVRGQRLESDGTRIFNIQDEKGQKAGYEQKGYFAKLGYDKDRLDTSVSISQNEGVNEYSDTGYLPSPQIDAQRVFDNRIINAKVAYDITDDITVSAQHTNVKDIQQVNAPIYNSHYNTKNKETGVNAKWSFAPNQNVLVGINHLDSAYDSDNIKDNTQKNKSTGYYAQHQYNNDKFNTQLGVRLENNDRFGNHTVGQGAIRYHFTPDVSVYANVGTAFRAPTLNEMYSTWYKANPDLKPEESLSYEIGTDFYVNDSTKIYASAYQTKVKNLIRSACLSNTNSSYCYNNTQYINIDKAQFTGGEVGVKWFYDDFFVNANYAYVKTENRSVNNANYGKELAYVPKHHGVIGAGYDNGLYGANISLNALSDSYSNKENTNKLAGYATVDLNGFWQVQPNIKLFTSIQNIGDKKYATSYYNMNGTGSTKYVNGGRQANVGVTFSY